ncbi:MAG TPA: phosphopantetheine-binding protein [Burkholderiales bacterium]|nr:phosphopantetheine-binding protein [Burkholderiales bacterium]
MSSYEDIKELLVTKFEVKPELIEPGATLADLGLDSLSTAELIFDIAEKYDLDIPDNRADFTTLGEAVKMVDELRRAKVGSA